MKRLLILISILTVVTSTMTAITHEYTDNSVLRTGTWVKIRVGETGVYRMTYEQLRDAGLSNPANVRIHGYGGAMLAQNFEKPKIDDLPAVGFYMEKGADGVFGEGDYILFYAQGSISWQYNGVQFVHTRNPYSDYGYYFLSDNAGQQNLLPTAEVMDGAGATDVTVYTRYLLHEEDLVNLLDRVNGVDGGGREFYGEQFSGTAPRMTFTFTIPNIVSTENILCNTEVAAYSTFRSSQFSVGLNGKSYSVKIDSLPSNDFYTKAKTGNINKSYPATNSTIQTVSVSFSNPNAGAVGALNYIELNAQCYLVMSGSQLAFRTSEAYGKATVLRYQLRNANSATQIWDVTDKAHIKRVSATLNGTILSFNGTNADGVREYIAVNTNGENWLTPTVIGAVDNQNLHRLRNIDYVIITPAEFVGEATRLAQAHERKQSITWAVVTDEQVYNEFSSGTPDATAYRWLMKMLYDRGTDRNSKPRWLLLMGDGTFDNRKLLSSSGQNTLLTYQAINSTVETKAYATDDYFGFLDNTEGDSDVLGRMDIGVGRLPVNTAEEAQQVVDKLVTYINNEQPDKWKSQLIFLADDGDNGLHTRVAEEGAERVRRKNPDFVVNKIYTDAYPQEVNASGESYPLAKNKLDNLLQNGALYMNYSGHGAYNGITNEGMMNLKSISKMTNKNQALWMFATCSFAHFDAGKRSAAEEAVLNPNGGAIGVISAARTVYATQNTYINRNFCDTLFGHKDVYSYNMTVGEALAIAKNVTGTDENKMSYVLLGDPALRLNYPTDYQVATETKVDTLRALDVQTIDGYIKDQDEQVVTWFNGKVNITVFDKMQKITTRDNDETNESKKQQITYNDYPNTLFSGATEVKDGRFSYTFMVPKDIRYNFGNGRIVYYAYDPTEEVEGVGHFENFIIGGTGSILAADTIGPQITLYLNTPAFVDGGTTYETPRFFADIEDVNGINTVGTGIGHDLLLVVDKDAKQTYVLNEFFTSADGSYQKGQVSYLMPEMEDGAHSLTFRAWDLLNNSSTATLNFRVEKGRNPSIYSVITYPNPVPATGILNLVVDYDQPDMVLQTELYIYDMSGRLMWKHEQANPDVLQLNLGEMGLAPGLYMYNIRIKTENSGYSKSSGKMVVVK